MIHDTIEFPIEMRLRDITGFLNLIRSIKFEYRDSDEQHLTAQTALKWNQHSYSPSILRILTTFG